MRYISEFSIEELKPLIFSLLISYAVIIGFNLILLQFPLTNLLGYEFSALNALLLTIISGIITLRWLKKHSFYSSTLISILCSFLLIPLTIIIIYSLSTKFCSFPDGILFYAVITVPSIFLGFTLGIFVNYISTRYQILVFSSFVFAIALIPILEIYFYPQIYFFNPLITFFPGSIYDEGIHISWKVVLYRSLNVLFALGILNLVFRDRLKNYKWRNITGVHIAATIFFFLSPYLGFSTNYTILEKLLPKKVITENFILHASESITDNEFKLLMIHSQYYYESLKNEIKASPSKKMEIFLFNSSELKRIYFGSGNADVAKPWLYQIYLNQETWQSTLKHEMAHIFSAEFGSTIFKLADSFNPFLIEGFATSLDPYRDELHVDYLSSLALQQTSEINIVHLLRGFNFFTVNSSLTYTYAGSFSKYLIDQYGIDKFKSFYSNIEFINVYGISPDSVFAGFENMLSEIVYDQNEHQFNYYFGRQSIVQKVCPRHIGNLLKSGWEQVENNDLEEAKLTFYDVLNKTQNYSAIVGLTECYELQDSISNAINLIETYIDIFGKSPFYYLLELRLADFYSKKVDYINSLKLYRKLSYQKPNITIDIIAQLRIKLLEKNIIGEYLLSEDSTKFEILLDLNKSEYFYPSIPSLINLAITTGQDYNKFIKQFNKTKFISDFYSSYAVYRLSKYMILNLDFRNARKMAALAKRYKGMEHFNLLWQNHFEKAEWFYYNAEQFLQKYFLKPAK